MYQAYWQLQRRPFDPGVDTTMYYPSEAHQAALLKLRYAIEARSGGALLAGPCGAGKTLIVRLLAERLGEAFQPFVHLVYPALPVSELLAFLAAEITGTPLPEATTADVSVRRIQQSLLANAAAGRHAVVAIDEAHLLDSRATFEALRLLLNFESDGHPTLTLLLVGEPGLLPQLDRLPQLDDRLNVKCLVRSLTVEETMGYVQHRLAAAGAPRSLFAPAAIETVHRLSHGLPRRINRLCDLALLLGYADDQKIVGAGQVEAIAGELITLAPAA